MKNNYPSSSILTLVLIIFLIVILGCVSSNNRGSETQPVNQTNLRNSTPKPTPVKLTPAELNKKIASSTSKENLENGKSALDNEDLDSAKKYLTAITAKQPEYKEALEQLDTLKVRENIRKQQRKEVMREVDETQKRTGGTLFNTKDQ